MKFELAACLFALAACGSDSKDPGTVDAPGGDVDATQGPDAPATGQVTFRLAPNGSTTYVGLPVSFAGPDGHVVSETMTDQNGAAVATIVAGSSVTAVYSGTTLITILDIQPGDNLVLDTDTASPSRGTVTVTSNTYATTNPTYYAMSAAGLDKSGISADLDLTDAQIAAGKYNLIGLVTSTTNSVATPVAYTTKLDLLPPDNGGPTSVALPAWKTDFDTITVALTNAPSDAATANLSVTPFIADQRYPMPTSLAAMFSNNQAGGALKIPKAGFTSYQVRTQLTSTSGHSGIVAFAPQAAPGLAQLDAATMLPFVHDLSLTLPAGATEPHASIVADGSLASASGAIYVIGYKQTGSAANVQQFVITAHPSTNLSLPDLGAAQAAYAPASPFTASAQQLAVIASGGLWTSAKDMRENWLRAFEAAEGLTPMTTQPFNISISQ